MAHFVDQFGCMFNAIHTRGVTNGDDFVTSPSDNEILSSIRSRYIKDASVGIVLLGPSTWTRRFVDWEIAAAIASPCDQALPLVLFDLQPRARSRTPLPPRLTTSGAMPLGRVIEPQSMTALATAVDRAMLCAASRSSVVDLLADPLLRSDLL